jgi:hypothetical protein
LLVCILAYLGRPFDAVREFGLSSPTVPDPNAHDLYKRANEAIRFAPVAVILDKPGLADEPEDAKKYPLAGKVRWLADNKGGFALFEQAKQAEYLYPPIRTPQEGGEIEPVYELRSLARDKVVECEVLAEQHQHEKAVNCALDIWKMGIDAQRGAPLVPALYGVIVESYGRRALNPEIAYLTGSQAGRAARRLAALLNTRVPYVEVLREERAAMLVQQPFAYAKAIRDKQQEEANAAAIEKGDYKAIHFDSGPAPELKGPIVNWMIRRLARQYASGMDILIADSTHTWPKRATTVPGVTGPNPKIVDLLSVLQKARFNFCRADALAEIYLARLALHAYRKDNTGILPNRLEALVPKYLGHVPPDPFSDNQPLRYQRAGTRYQLWSIGPDARDDRGRPTENTHSRKPSGRYLVTEDGTGDIVANINK